MYGSRHFVVTALSDRLTITIEMRIVARLSIILTWQARESKGDVFTRGALVACY